MYNFGGKWHLGTIDREIRPTRRGHAVVSNGRISHEVPYNRITHIRQS